LLLIQHFDATTLRAIGRALQQSDLGLNPQDDGRVIRLVLPALTESRRKELVKQVRVRVEEVRVSVRNHRREAIEELRELEHEKLISEDELRRAQERLQELTDRAIKEVEQIGVSKEAEVMEV
jgi:ribosome recycling factor